MKISKNIQEMVDKEIDYAIAKMEESQTPDDMLFFFSGIHAVINRAFNFEFSTELLFVHFVLENSYKKILERIQQMKSGSTVVKFHDDFGLKLIELSKNLKKNFYKKTKRIEVLNEIALLSYSTTGNGYYLLQKNALPIFQEKKKTSI